MTKTPAELARFKRRLGKCYELAGYEFIMDERWPDGRLVHGTVGPNENPHAWVEFERTLKFPDGTDYTDTWAWEPISESEWPVGAFDNVYCAANRHKYALTEARDKIFATKNWGPWDGDYFVIDRRPGSRRKRNPVKPRGVR